MATIDEDFAFQEDDHRAAYIFTAPDDGDLGASNATPSSSSRPSKRRRVSGANTSASKQQQQKRKSNAAAAAPAPTTADDSSENGNDNDTGLFIPLFNGAESKEAVELRRKTFEEAWDGCLEERIRRVLREANANTLDEVSSFIREANDAAEAEAEAEVDRTDMSVGIGKKIPAGFIITGPNIASQDLLFEQLSETLSGFSGGTRVKGRVVRLRSAGAPNLKAALKKIIRDAGSARVAAATSLGDGEGEDDAGEVSVGVDGRKYLDYDLEGLHVFLKTKDSRRVIVAFEDSEAFDNGLLTDLIALFHSWQGRIQFSLLFGIATSVELFQARLLKSTAKMLYGAQFDVVQADSVLESVFKSAVAGAAAMVRLGPGLLRSLLERQKDQVAGIHVFISSLKYAYMCHFYANPLSVCLAESKEVEKTVLQKQHLQALRTLPSFRSHVETSIEEDRQVQHAENLIAADWYLQKQIYAQRKERKEYILKLLRCLHLLTSAGLLTGSFTDIYVNALEHGMDLSSDGSFFGPGVIDAIKRLTPDEILSVTRSLVKAIRTGCPELDLAPWEEESNHWGLIVQIKHVKDGVKGLMKEVAKAGNPPLKSKYTAQSKVLRTTVVAQKVQLSRDSAALTEQDKKFTGFVDSLIDTLAGWMFFRPLESLFLHEVWVYDSRLPYREVFIPRPGAVIDRALARPHDYLNCSCCSGTRKSGDGEGGEGVVATMPSTAILYHLYMEAGSLVNVADLWSAYFALVGDESDSGDSGAGMDERTALLHFYRGLAELKALGFVKGSKKKADHVAKVKWV